MKKPNINPLWIPVLTAVSAFLIFVAANTASIIIFTSALITLNVGTLIFAFTFFWKDFIQKKMGRNFAIVNNLIAAALVLLISLEIGLLGGSNGFAWAGILLASFAAVAIAETIDSIVYSKVKGDVKPALISNLVGVPIDTAIFSFFAFYLILGMPVNIVIGLAVAQMLVKYTLSGVLSPLLKLTKREME